MCFGLAQFYLFVKYIDLISYIILNNKDTMGSQQNKFAPHTKLSTVQLQTLTSKKSLKMMTIDYYFYQSSVDRIFGN